MMLRARGVLLLGLLLASGCAPLIERRSAKLGRASISPDSVVLEIYSARFPFDDAKLNQGLWQQVEEQSFPADVRRTMTEYGVRAGILQGQVPSELQELLAGATEGQPPPPKPPDAGAAPTLEQSVVDFEEQSPVRRRLMTLRTGGRGEILASGIYESLPLLENEGGQLRGKPYPQGQGVFGVKSFPQPDGRVRLDLLPELQHGEPKLNYVGDQGIIRLETARSKKAFDKLALSATLSPGEMLLVTSLPQRPGSLGHYFFTEQRAGVLEQKLLIIRLAQTQHDDLFDAPPASK